MSSCPQWQKMETKKGLLFVAAAFTAAALTPLAVASLAVPAIYVFGDSTVDVGNNNFLPGNQSKANFSPYGIDFPGGKPTGRFTNGYGGIDFFAKKLGFNKSPPAYLSIANHAQASRGVSFASGGSGIFDATGQNISIPLNQQIRYFRRVSRRLRNRIGSRAASRFLSKSIIYFSTGSNDMFSFYANSGIQNKTLQNFFITQLTDQFKIQLETLYDLGARKYLVFGTSLIGCVPIQRLTVPGGECFEYLNNLSHQFSEATRIALHDLASNLQGFSYSFFHAYDFVSLLSSEPRKYGFKEEVSACCGSGRFNAESGCSPDSNYCPNRDEYVFWDPIHPTQAFYQSIVRSLFRGDPYASPVSIKQLIRHVAAGETRELGQGKTRDEDLSSACRPTNFSDE